VQIPQLAAGVRGDKDIRARDGLALVSSRWGLPVLEQLHSGPRRFNELQRLVPGVSHRMLAAPLRRCIAQGVVLRTDHQANPPHVDYQLTDAGRGLLTTAWGFCAWSSEA
jgi:DNA-binding HxlR family transcriptional regulator